MLRAGFFRLFDDHLDVTYRVIEVVKGEVFQGAKIEHVPVFRRILQRLVQVTLGVLQHLCFCFGFDGLVKSVAHYGDRAEEEGVSVGGDLLACFREERDCVLVLVLVQALQTLA